MVLRTRARSDSAFTLIELLVVVAIIIILIALLGAGLGRARSSAREKATRALIGKLKVALQSYHGEFRDFPPDGYDVEIAGTDNTGAPVGTPARKLKGTALLMYFLCRPVTKITKMGDPNETDPRNTIKTTVGPFLELSPSNYSRGRGDQGSTDDLSRFEPNFAWNGTRATAFWDNAPNTYRVTEIIDAYGRPLCYDKVKTDQLKYFQPERFHKLQLGGSVTANGAGVHPDVEYLQTGMPVMEDHACDDPNHGPGLDAPEDQLWAWHPDPRLKPGVAAADGCCPKTTTTGSASSHMPKSVGNFDLWSFGPSYTNPRDDITSWGE